MSKDVDPANSSQNAIIFKVDNQVGPTGQPVILPTGGTFGQLLWWDGFNWVTLDPPQVAAAQTLVYTTGGPAWLNV